MKRAAVAAEADEPLLRENNFPVVAIVSSAGGLQATGDILSDLPVTFPGAVICLQHLSPHSPSHLPELLQRRTRLPVLPATNGALLHPSRVLVIPAARHLVVGSDARVRLIPTGDIPPARPSADLLLSTLAVALGPRAIAIVLTGRGTDGALGAQVIHAYGGRTLVQDDASSREHSMPAAVIATRSPAVVLPLRDIAEMLRGWSRAAGSAL